MTRYLITGAQGFIGRYLVSHLLSEQPEPRILGIGRSRRLTDRFTHFVRWGSHRIPAPLTCRLALAEEDNRYEYASVDINQSQEMERVLAAFRPDVIIHLASGLRGDAPASLFKTNVEGTINLLNAAEAAAIPLRKVVIGSSGGVYGACPRSPIAEDETCLPADIYSTSKLAQEHAARILAKERSWRIVFARIFNVLGPGQDERHICGEFAAAIAGILSDLMPPVISHGELDATRDMIDVRDVARGIAMIADPAVPDGTFNIGGGIESSMHEVLRTLLDLAALNDKVVLRHRVCGPTKVPRHVASINGLRSLGFQCRYTLRRSLSDLLAYYLEDVRTRFTDSASHRVPVEPVGQPAF